MRLEFGIRPRFFAVLKLITGVEVISKHAGKFCLRQCDFAAARINQKRAEIF